MTYFLDRIRDGKDPLNNTSADFTSEESDKIYQIIQKHASVAQTKQSLDEYIKVIREESAKPKPADIANMGRARSLTNTSKR